jgi:hypothetical protein
VSEYASRRRAGAWETDQERGRRLSRNVVQTMRCISCGCYARSDAERLAWWGIDKQEGTAPPVRIGYRCTQCQNSVGEEVASEPRHGKGSQVSTDAPSPTGATASQQERP